MKKISIKLICESAIIAALYAVLTWVLAPISYGAIQFRLSEVLILIAVFNPKFIPALIIGCFIANTTSSLGWYDMLFGTLATTIALIPMIFIKKLNISSLMKLIIASILPVISNAFIVSIELGIAFDMFQPEVFWFNVLTVGFGEAVVLYLVGVPLFIGLSKNEAIVTLLEFDVKKDEKLSFFNLSNAISLALGALGIILFVAYPIYQVFGSEGYTNTTMLDLVREGYYIPIMVIAFSISYTVLSFLLKNKLKLIILIANALLFFIPFVFIAIKYNYVMTCPYFYGFMVYIGLLIIDAVIDYILNKKAKSNEIKASNIEDTTTQA